MTVRKKWGVREGEGGGFRIPSFRSNRGRRASRLKLRFGFNRRMQSAIEAPKLGSATKRQCSVVRCKFLTNGFPLRLKVSSGGKC